MGAPVNPSFTQAAFRFKNDDGSGLTATWKAAINTNIDERPYKIIRCKFLIQQTVSNANQNLTRSFKLKYSLNGGAYTDVGAQGSSTIIRCANSSNVTDDSQSLTELTVNTAIGLVDENNLVTVAFPSGTTADLEVEFVLELYGGLINLTDSLDLRVYESNDTLLSVYTNTANIKRKRRLRVLG